MFDPTPTETFYQPFPATPVGAAPSAFEEGDYQFPSEEEARNVTYRRRRSVLAAPTLDDPELSTRGVSSSDLVVAGRSLFVAGPSDFDLGPSDFDLDLPADSDSEAVESALPARRVPAAYTEAEDTEVIALLAEAGLEYLRSESFLEPASSTAAPSVIPPVVPPAALLVDLDSDSDSSSNSSDSTSMSYPTTSAGSSSQSAYPVMVGSKSGEYREYRLRCLAYLRMKTPPGTIKLDDAGNPTVRSLQAAAYTLKVTTNWVAVGLMEALGTGSPAGCFLSKSTSPATAAGPALLGVPAVMALAAAAGTCPVTYFLDMLGGQYGVPTAQEKHKLTHMKMGESHNDLPVPVDEDPDGCATRIINAHSPFASKPLLTETMMYEMYLAALSPQVLVHVSPVIALLDEADLTIAKVRVLAQNAYRTVITAQFKAEAADVAKRKPPPGGGAGPSGGIQRQASDRTPANNRDRNHPPPPRPGGAPWLWCESHMMWCAHETVNCKGTGKPGESGGSQPTGTVKKTKVRLSDVDVQQLVADAVGKVMASMQGGQIHATQVGQGGQQQQQQQQQFPQQQRPQQQQQFTLGTAGKPTVRRGNDNDAQVGRPCLLCGDVRHGRKYCWIAHPELVDEEKRATYRVPLALEAHYLAEIKRLHMRLPEWAPQPQGQVRYTQQQSYGHSPSEPPPSSSNFGAYAAEHLQNPSVAGAYPYTQQDARSEGNYSVPASASGYLPPVSQGMHRMHYTQVAEATTNTAPKEVRFTLGVGDDRHPEEAAGTVNSRPLPRSFGRIPRDSSTPVPSASASRSVHPLAAAPAVIPATATAPDPADHIVTVLVEPTVSNVTVIVKTRESPVAASDSQLLALHATQCQKPRVTPAPASQLTALHATQRSPAQAPAVTPQVLVSALRKTRPGDTIHPSAYERLPVIPLSDLKPGDAVPDFFHAAEHTMLVDVEGLKTSFAGSVASLPYLPPEPEQGLSFPTGEKRDGKPAAIKKALIDTGATVSVADVKVVRALGLRPSAAGAMCISTSTGAIEPVAGLLVDLICTLALGTPKEVQFCTTFLCMETTDKSFEVILGVHVMKQLGLWADPLLQMVFYRPFLHDGSFNLTLSWLPLICVEGGHTIKLSGCHLIPPAVLSVLPAPEFCMGRVLKTGVVLLPAVTAPLADEVALAEYEQHLMATFHMMPRDPVLLSQMRQIGMLPEHPVLLYSVSSSASVPSLLSENSDASWTDERLPYVFCSTHMLRGPPGPPTPAPYVDSNSYTSLDSYPAARHPLQDASPINWESDAPYNGSFLTASEPISTEWRLTSRVASMEGLSVDFSVNPAFEEDVFYDPDGEKYGQQHYFDCYEEVSTPLPAPQVLLASTPAVTVIGKVSAALKGGWDWIWGGISVVAKVAVEVAGADPMLYAFLLLLYRLILLGCHSFSVPYTLVTGAAVNAAAYTAITYIMWRRWYSLYVNKRCKSSTHKHRLKVPRPRDKPQPPAPRHWYSSSRCLTALKALAVIWLVSWLVVGAAATGAAVASVSPPGGLQHYVHGTSLYGASWTPSYCNMGHKVLVDPYSWEVPGPAAVHASWSHVRSTVPDGVQYHTRADSFTKDPGGWIMGNHPDMSDDDRADFRAMIATHTEDFAMDLSQLGRYKGRAGPMSITLSHTDPIRSGSRKYSHLEAQVRDEKCTELEQHGIIVESTGATPYVSRCTVAAKKDLSGEWTEKRFCVDYRRINEATAPDKYGLHLPEDLFEQVRGSRFFTKIDLRSGFHQIPLTPEDQVKTCFWWKNKVYQYTCMPFGLRNAPAHFQRCMDAAVDDARMTDCAFCYVDDLLIYSATADEHIKHVDAAFDMLHGVGMRIHPDKSVFGTDVIEYLGHNVSAYGVTPHEAKTAAIRALPSPKNIDELRSVLGFINYYRCYIPEFASLAQPLYLLLKKDQPFVWADAQQKAYEALKDEVCKEGQALRRFDPEATTLVYTDWSALGIGAVLAQVAPDGTEYMVACISRSLNKHEKNYASYYGEMLGAVWGVKTLRPYLHGIHFTLVSDHRPLTFLMENENLTGQHARWALAMQEFDFTIQYRKGLEHVNVDVPSRFPLPSHEDGTGARLDVDPADQEEVTPFIPRAPPAPPSWPEPKPHFEAPIHSTVSVHRLHWAYTQPAVNPSVQEIMPDPTQLLQGHLGMVCDEYDAVHMFNVAEHTDQQRVLDCARHWVRHAVDVHGPTFWNLSDPSPAFLNGTSMGTDFWHATRNDGIVLLETFAGIATGLEMCIRNGIKVQRYLYCDKDPVAKRVAQHRAWLLHEEFPTLLPTEALAHAFHALPDDIHHITHSLLATLVKEEGPVQWFYVAGWECQDLSPAGVGRGLAGNHSSTFYACVNVIRDLQILLPDCQPAYLLENTYMQVARATPQVQADFQFLCKTLGNPVSFDATQVGSLAHRMRNYWTNLAPAQILQRVFSTIIPDAYAMRVQDVLEPDRVPAPVLNPSVAPQFPVHPYGYNGPRRALPTLVATPGSYAFHPGKVGSIFDELLGAWTEPLAIERERAMGFTPGTTDVNISETQRRTLLGRCMDINAVTSLVAVAAQLAIRAGHVHTVHLTNMTLLHPSSPPDHACFANHIDSFLLSMLAESDDSVCAPTVLPSVHTTLATPEAPRTSTVTPQAWSPTDIWLDSNTLAVLHFGLLPVNLDDKEHKRAHRRAQSYRAEFQEGATLPFNLSRILRDGSARTVPPPADRIALVTRTHVSTGHFGVKRTRHLMLTSYWWDGIAKDVYHVVRSCSECDRINHSGMNTRDANLQPLPMEGLFYRWGVDLFGPLHRSSMGNTYVLVAIEHFSKHIELIPMPDKLAFHTAYAFSQVLGRFGAPAEVITDLGKEFLGEFEELLQTCFIDHRQTSPNHPAANGLAERAVQTVKRSLRKYLADGPVKEQDWEVHLPWILLGYRASVQASTRMSPFEMLYARRPTVPPAVRERFLVPLTFEDADAAADEVLRRAEAVRQAMILAGEGIKIAQARDTLRYAKTRSGNYLPRIHRFEIGDYIYLKDRQLVSLDMPVRDTILRVIGFTPTGNLILLGADTAITDHHPESCVPCHLPDIDPIGDPSLFWAPKELSCQVCHSPAHGSKMPLCDFCNRGWHIYCLSPPLPRVPAGAWLCPVCVKQGRTLAELGKLERQRLQHAGITPPLFTTDELAILTPYHGKLVSKPFTNGASTRRYTGVVLFQGHDRAEPFFVHFSDGDSQSMSLADVMKYLCPQQSPVPKRLMRFAEQPLQLVAHTTPVVLPVLPHPGPITCVASLADHLAYYLPGPWPPHVVQSLFAELPGRPHLEHVAAILERNVAPLGAVFALNALPSITPIFDDAGTLVTLLGPTCALDSIYDWSPAHYDSPASISDLLERLDPRSSIIGAPPWSVIDVLLSALASLNRPMVSFLVPVTYLSQPNPARSVWLCHMQGQRRLHTLAGLPPPLCGPAVMWLSVFSSEAMQRQLLRPFIDTTASD